MARAEVNFAPVSNANLKEISIRSGCSMREKTPAFAPFFGAQAELALGPQRLGYTWRQAKLFARAFCSPSFPVTGVPKTRRFCVDWGGRKGWGFSETTRAIQAPSDAASMNFSGAESAGMQSDRKLLEITVAGENSNWMEVYSVDIAPSGAQFRTRFSKSIPFLYIGNRGGRQGHVAQPLRSARVALAR